MTYEELAEELLQLTVNGSYMKVIRELESTTRPEIFVLLYLKRHNRLAHPKELSDTFHVSTARIAVIINKLEEKECVRRAADENDTRRTIVELTDKGEELITEQRKDVVSRLAEMLETVGEKDAMEYIRILKKMSAASDSLMCPRKGETKDER